MSVFEWLKSLHKKPRLPGQTEPLYRDVRLSVALFYMVFCDDPFEVKLRDNYELREDEFRESLKRERMLDGKIEELRRTPPLLSSDASKSPNQPVKVSPNKNFVHRVKLMSWMQIWEAEMLRYLFSERNACTRRGR